MNLLEGKRVSEKILEDLRIKIKENNLKLKLAIILVGDDAPSKMFIKRKEEACKKIGISFELFLFPKEILISDLKKEVEKICNNAENNGIVIQLPLPENLRAFDQQILNLVPPEKDVDILSEKNLGHFYSGFSPIVPPVVGAISCLLKEYEVIIKGKNVVLVGAGRLVGFPLAVWLLKEKATVSVINEFTDDAPDFLKKADIVISGVGKPGLIRGESLKEGVIVVDAGSSIKNGISLGDVDFESASKKAKYISPVPGGVGPLTVSCLLDNLVKINLD